MRKEFDKRGGDYLLEEVSPNSGVLGSGHEPLTEVVATAKAVQIHDTHRGNPDLDCVNTRLLNGFAFTDIERHSFVESWSFTMRN